MKIIDRLKNLGKQKELNGDLERFETGLTESLITYKPRPQFVNNLRHNLLQQFPSVNMIASQPQHQVLKTGLLVTSGIIGSVILLLTGVRGFISLLGVGGLLISWLKQNTQNNLTPADPVR